MDNQIIEIHNLRKEFLNRVNFWSNKKRNVLAIDDISLNVKKGELFGVLGPNGAGKTTTIKIMSTILLPTAGRVIINDYDVTKQTQEVRKTIGFCFGGSRGLYARLSAIDNLKYFAELYRMEPFVVKKRIFEVLDLVGLSTRGNDKVETFSTGMNQRLHLARALLHDPDIIFLDEPTIGIDPIGARTIRKIVKDLSIAGKTILLTTHYMAEAEELCDRIAIIKSGRVIAIDKPDQLKSKVKSFKIMELTIVNDSAASIMDVLNKSNECMSIELIERDGNEKVIIQVKNTERLLEVISPYINSRGIKNIEIRNHTLEDVYISMIEEN